MRPLIVISSALLALAACKKEQPAAAPAQPPAGTKAAAEPAGRKVVIDEPVIEKYAAFQKDLLVAAREAVVKSNEAAKAADKDSTLSKTAAAAKIAEAMREIGRREEELLRKHGLTRAQMEQTRELVSDVLAARMLLKTTGGTQGLIQQMREAIKTMPEDQRAQAEAEVAKMEKDFADMTNAADARKKYGDAAVEAVLKHEEELAALQTEALKSLGGK